MKLRYLLSTTVAFLLVAGCTPSQAQTPGEGAGQAQAPRSTRTLTMMVRSEASSAAAKGLLTSGSNVTPSSIFNAGIAVRDERDVAQAYLVEALPQLNSESWRVFPDGRMETTYRLKPNLVWHDGTPLSAQDFVFALKVYHNPLYGSSSPRPQNIIERIEARDERTAVIHWTQPYPEASELEAGDIQALPRHILAEPLERLEPDAFAAHPFWTTEYVGLGPYRIEKWDPGISLEAVAFDRYVRSRPKIDRIRIVYMNDPNTVLANLLAGAADVATANSLPFNQALVLKRQWGDAGAILQNSEGAALTPSSRTTEFQLNPERVAPSLAGTLDVRVRRAMAHAIDKQAVDEAVFEGQGIPANTRISPMADLFPLVERVITKYPFDLRRSEQLMNEAGYVKGPDGIFLSPTGMRFAGEDWIAANPQSELTQNIMLDTWKRAGFDISPYAISTVQQRDARVRAERPGLYTGDGGSLFTLGSGHIPRPENRWTGSNRGSYSSPEFDRLLHLWDTTLDRNERIGHLVEMARVSSEDLPSIPLHFNLGVTAHVAGLLNVKGSARDIHLWEWRS